MKQVITWLMVSLVLALPALADRTLDKPLRFVPSDSTVVWGEDRSDFRATAMTVIPHPESREMIVGDMDAKTFKKMEKEWKKEIAPAFDILGGQGTSPMTDDLLSLKRRLPEVARLFLQTGDAQYMNVIERMAFNRLMSLIQPGEGSFEKYQAARMLLDISDMVYATDEEGIYVNLYINSSTRIKTGNQDCVIDQLTAMPHSSRVKLRVSGLRKGMQPIKLRLRMPDWVCATPVPTSFSLTGTPRQLPVIYVNGREETYEVENGYLVIDRRWNSGDEVFFDFPFHMQQLRPGQSDHVGGGAVALQCGPLVYGFGEDLEGWSLPENPEFQEMSVPNAYGHSRFEVTLSDPRGQKAVKVAEPVMDGIFYPWIGTK